MPRSFAFNDTTGAGDLYLPSSLMRSIANVPCMAYLPWIKLRPHVTLAAANAALEPLVREFAKEPHPARLPDRWHLALQPIIVPYQQRTWAAPSRFCWPASCLSAHHRLRQLLDPSAGPRPLARA